MSLLTFRRLERHGRLGNQMWQLASTIGIAERMGATPIFPRWSYAPYFSLPEDLWADEIPGEAVGAETTTNVQHIADRHRGYLQDRALWAHIQDRIVDYFQPSPLALQVMALTHPTFFDVPAEKRIAIHIRRGDAVGIPHLYPLQSPLYVRGALEQFDPGHVTLFGDDPGWMMDNLGELGTVMGGNADWADMFLMASCQPAGTLVRTSKGDVPIEDIRVGMRVLSYSQKQTTLSQRMLIGREQPVKCLMPSCTNAHCAKGLCRQHLYRWMKYDDPLGTSTQAERGWYEPPSSPGPGGYPPGRRVDRVAARPFDGDLVSIKAGSLVTRYTPDHLCIAKIGDAFTKRTAVYIMRLGDKFRVGVTPDPRRRLSQLAADACWIVATFDDRRDALMEEKFIAASYGVPDVVFGDWHGGARHARAVEFWDRFGDNAEAGLACLRRYGRDVRYPLFIGGEKRVMVPDRELEIRACNLLDEMWVLDVDRYAAAGGAGLCSEAWVPITTSREPYQGLVYSMDVAINHSYVGDGILTHNCAQIAIANSSFSYWAAATSKATKVCYPLAWYGRKFHDLDFRLMIPDAWVGIRDAMAGAQ